MNQRTFSREEKLHILHQLLSGEKYLSQLSREFGVSHTAICESRSFTVLEHFIPVINRIADYKYWVLLGGTTAQNCVPACHGCNARKGGLSPEYLWKTSQGTEQGRFPTLAMIARIGAYLQVDLDAPQSMWNSWDMDDW